VAGALVAAGFSVVVPLAGAALAGAALAGAAPLLASGAP
jgi:hypothetical protein